jgi:photosystem II stability/assembly factor-like uncharacterized protein
MAAPEQLLQDTLDPNVLYLAYSAALDSGTFTRWDISTNTVTELIGSKSPGRVFADSVQLGRYWFDVFSSPPNYNGYGMFESTDGGMTWPYVNDLPGGLIGSDPLLADVLYGNDAVGFAVSLDAGRTWASRTSGIPLISAQVVSQDPIHPLRLAASGGAGVALSDDGGLTWTWATTPPDEPVLTFGRVPGDASRLLAGTRNALYRSDDAGHTWQHLTQPYDHFNDIAVDRGDPQKLVAVRGFAVAWSSDGGATWTPATVVGGATDFRRIVRGQIGTNRVYVLRFVHNDVNQLFRADAHGDSLVPTEGNLEVSDAAVDPSDDAVLFAVAHDETYRDWTGYLSTDAGAHWQTRGTIAQVQNGSEARVRFDPCEPRTVYLLLGSRGMYVSRDRGLTWSLEAPDVPFGYTWDFDVACSSGELVASVATNGAGVEVRDPEFIDGVFGGGFDGE